MNVVLDSPVEALAFNYLSFGFLTLLNNLWTWLALLTAALSFWKIRSAGCPKPAPAPLDPTTEPPVPEALTPLAEPAVRDAVPSAVTNGDAEDVDGVRKGKFAVYYEKDDEDAQCRRGESEWSLTAWEEREGCEAEWWERWERLLRLRNGVSGNGWYTWQDLTELNGNVVRLWDGGLRCRESWYTSSCVDVW